MTLVKNFVWIRWQQISKHVPDLLEALKNPRILQTGRLMTMTG